jgi:hypothetical protein
MESEGIQFSLRGIGTELKEKFLSVPIYQRSFSWGPDETAEFWADLDDAFHGNATEYFMGTIVLTRKDDVSSTIIDGQQRLATAGILLAAIRDEYAARGDTGRATTVQSTYLSNSDLDSGGLISKLTLNSEDAHLFDSRIINGKNTPSPSKPSHELILAAYMFFRQQVKKTADDAGSGWAKRLTQWVAFIQTKAKAMVLQVPTDADAFLIFETLNDRGADLTIADLLKNYLFGHAGSKLDPVRDGWMQVLGSLEISAENMLFTTFLRHYWSSLRGAVRERELYKSIKNHVATEPQAVDFIANLQSAASIYAALLSSGHDYWDDFGTTVRENVETLLRLDLVQHRPLLLAALQHFTIEEKKTLLRALVSWSVRGLVVGGIGGGTAEKAFCQAAVKIRTGAIHTTAEVLQEIGAIVPSDANFRESFTTARLPKATIARYFLIALERGKQGISEPEFVPNSNEEQVNLEHVLPKRASAADWGAKFNAEERKEYLHRIGNLSLLQKGPNGKIGNKPFATKKPILGASSFALTKEVGAQADWTKEAIAKRQGLLAQLAVKVWPRT